MEISYAILVNFFGALLGVELPPTASAQLLFDPQCNTLVIHYQGTVIHHCHALYCISVPQYQCPKAISSVANYQGTVIHHCLALSCVRVQPYQCPNNGIMYC